MVSGKDINPTTKLRYGMVGGGRDAFIGAVHRMAAALDQQAEFVAGALSSSPEKSLASGRDLGLADDRNYESWQQMLERESARPAEDRIDFVSIVTPNHVHFPVAKAFVEAGFHVVLDKPMVLSSEEASQLAAAVNKSGVVFAVTYNYTGYPMVKQARALIADGKLGTIRKVVVEYPQGWLSTLLESEGAKQAVWRTDPKQAGVSSAIGDIGSHAENLARYITGLEIEKICADLTTFVPGRLLEDDANMLVQFKGGARGVLYCSQVSVGEENNLRIRVYGTEASLEWHQEHPNYVYLRYNDGPEEVYKRGNGYLTDVAQHNTRLPSGHPEAFLEAFANIYVNAARTMAAKIAGEAPGPFDTDFPTVQDGAVGVHFIHTAVASGKKKAWVDASYTPPA